MPENEVPSGEGSPHLFEAPIDELAQSEQLSRVEANRRIALVHILTPEFHGFDPEEFTHIPDEIVARASAADLQPNLFWPYIPKRRRQSEEVSSFSYLAADETFISVALTPNEYNEASESVSKLAERVINRVLTLRDKTLRKETGDPTARARSPEDIKTANRGAMRAVMDRQSDMEKLLKERILPKQELIKKFIEMTEDNHFYLSRGTKRTVSERFEELRTTVFDDMLDAIGRKRKWSDEMTARAKQIIQKRLYISGTKTERLENFREMMLLAQEYYGHKWALISTKIEEARKYQRDHPEVTADILAVDEQRRKEKEREVSEQLRLENT